MRKRWRIILTMVLILLTFVAPIAQAATTKVTTTNTTSLFDTYNSTSKAWNELLAAKHRATIGGVSRVVYCIQHKKSSPNSVNYDLTNALSGYTEKVQKGIQIIIDNGYPRNSGTLTAAAAEYATANALRFWLSENGDTQFYNQTNLSGFTDAQLRTSAANGTIKDKIRVRNSSYIPALQFSAELLIAARAQVVYEPQLNAGSIVANHSSGKFAGTTQVTHNGLRGKYEVDISTLPSGSTVTGHTGASGETLTISIPATDANANKSYTVKLKGYDDRTRGNIQALNHATDASYQRVLVAITDNMEVITKSITVQTGAMPKPDLIVSALTTDKTSYNAGETVTVTATVKNQGTANAAASKAALAVTGQTTQTKDCVALNVGATANISYTFTAPTSTSAQTLTLTATADSANAVAESNETNNTRSTTVTINAALPDLVVSALTPNKTAYSGGETMTVTATIANNGTNNAGACKVSLAGTGLTTQTKDIGALNKGANTTVSFTFTAPRNTTAQTITFTATADSANVVAESNEGNNTRTATATVSASLPDLVVSALSTNKTAYSGGETMTVTATIANNGANNAAACKVSLAGTGLTTQTKDISAVNMGANTVVSFTFTAPVASSAQTITFTATADSANVVAESNEGNNTRTATATVSTSLPDLVVSALSTNKTAYSGGETITVTATIANNGANNAGACKVSLAGTGLTTQTKDIAALNKGASTTVSFTFTAPRNMSASTITFTATADSANVVVESNEGNNTRTTTATVSASLPDLVVSALTTNKTSYSGGETITVTATIANNGANNAGVCKVSLAGTGLTTQTKDIAALNMGASTAVTFTFAAPTVSSAQTITFTATADSANVVAESNEGNNTRTATATVNASLPDLTVTNVRPGKTSYNAGETVTIIATITNQGATDTGTFVVSFNVNGNTYTATVPGLPSKGSKDVSITYTAPTLSSTVTYPVTVVADSTNVIKESNETNNTGTGSVVINGEKPDLTVTSIKSGQQAYEAGETVTVTAVVSNIGAVASPASEIQLHDEDGKEVQVLSVPALSANGYYTATFKFTAPSISGGKVKQYTAFADHREQINEKREDNNKASLNVEILAPLPDLTVTKVRSDKERYGEDEEGTVIVTVLNQGGKSVSDAKLRLKLDDFFSETVSTGKLNVGESVEIRFSFTAPEATAVREILATAHIDPQNVIEESNEDNNILTGQLSVRPILPDLTIINTNAQAYYTGRDVVVTAVIENLTRTAVPSVKVRLELSGVANAGYDTNICVPGNITNLAVFRISLPYTPGSLNLKFIIDPDNDLPEEHKDNNTYTRTVEVVNTPEPMVIDPDVGEVEDVFWNSIVFNLATLRPSLESIPRVDWMEYRYIEGQYVPMDFYAELVTDFAVKPDPRIAYPDSIMMESGFGIEAHAETRIETNYDHPEKIIAPQMIWLTYPESGYAREVYHSVFDPLMLMDGTPGEHSIWAYAPSPLSQKGSRLHFTPLWYPNGDYVVSGQVFYAWAPAGQLFSMLESKTEIYGNMYDRVTAVQGRDDMP